MLMVMCTGDKIKSGLMHKNFDPCRFTKLKQIETKSVMNVGVITFLGQTTQHASKTL